jgi:hypothetical protein
MVYVYRYSIPKNNALRRKKSLSLARETKTGKPRKRNRRSNDERETKETEKICKKNRTWQNAHKS